MRLAWPRSLPKAAPSPPPSSLRASTTEASSSALLAPLLARFVDPATDELLVNGTRSLGVVRLGRLDLEASPFRDDDALIEALQDFALAQRVRLDPLSPSGGGAFDGHAFRWHALLPPLAPEGALFALRRHRFGALGLGDFAASPELRAQLRSAMQKRRNLLVAGPTGCGKTSLLAALLAAEAGDERVLIVEALEELPLISSGWVRLLERRPNLEGVGGVSLRRLVHEALRLRPDRLVVGEIRSDEAGAFVEAALTGHSGLLATIHAGSLTQALRRLRLLGGGGSSAGTGLWNELAASLTLVLLRRGVPPQIVALEGLGDSGFASELA